MVDEPGVSILLVDDTPANLVALEAVLQPLGARLVQASSGEEALKRLLDEEFACVLLDVQMPGMDGFETAQFIRQRERTRHLPILFLTALHRADENIRRGYIAGAVDYIVKPFDPDILRAKVGFFVELDRRERKLRADEAALRERERADQEVRRADLYRLLMQAPSPVCVQRGPQFVFEFVNPAYSALLGNRPLVGRPVREAIPELEGQPMLEMLQRVFTAGEPFVAEELPLTFHRPGNGKPEEGIFRYTVVPLRDGTGRVTGLAHFGFEITEQVRARTEAQLLAAENARLYAEAREAIRMRDEFLSVASHELKTPLTPLSLRLSALLHPARTESLPERLVSDLGSMRNHLRRLADLVNELLDVSRLSIGQLHLDLTELALDEVVQEVVGRFAPQAERAGCAVQVEVHGDTQGTWDRVRIEQVVTNLLSNAIKYGPHKPISIRVAGDGEHVRLLIRDEGIGIDAESLERIFGKFERAVSERHYGGLGLGLYITRQIVEAFGGRIAVESTPGKGAVFSVTLPRTPPAPSRPVRTEGPAQPG